MITVGEVISNFHHNSNNLYISLLDSEILLSHILDTTRANLIVHPEILLTDEDYAEYKKLLQRRLNGEPIAYLTNKKEFFSREFYITQDVLIPRPETEILVEIALKKIKKGDIILDVGAGSGCIGITIKLENPSTTVIASDISERAIAVAQTNQRLLNADVNFIVGNLLDFISDSIKFNMIISNPPYIATSEIKNLQKEIQQEPKLALDAGIDGMYYITRLVSASPKILKEGGYLFFEFGYCQDANIQSLNETQNKLELMDIYSDLVGIPRFACFRKIA